MHAFRALGYFALLALTAGCGLASESRAQTLEGFAGFRPGTPIQDYALCEGNTTRDGARVYCSARRPGIIYQGTELIEVNLDFGHNNRLIGLDLDFALGTDFQADLTQRYGLSRYRMPGMRGPLDAYVGRDYVMYEKYCYDPNAGEYALLIPSQPEECVAQGLEPAQRVRMNFRSLE